MKIQQTAEIETPWTAWFLYGATGAGKTTAAATFPDPLFLIPTNEGSETTLMSRGMDFPFVRIGRDDSDKPIPARRHLNEIFQELEERHRTMRKLLKEGDEDSAFEVFPWQTIVVESLTHLCDLIIEDISQYGREKMDQQKWGFLSTQLRTIHNRLRNMDVHIVYTALDKLDGGENSKKGIPNVVGSMAEKLPAACDVMGYLEEINTAKATTHRMHFKKFGVYRARTRFHRFPKFVDNFDYADLEPLFLSSDKPKPEKVATRAVAQA